MRDAGIYGGGAQAYASGQTGNQLFLSASDKEMKKRLDLIFCSVNRNKTNMDFEHFLQSLVKVAEAKYGTTMSASKALKTLMDHHMLPLAAQTI